MARRRGGYGRRGAKRGWAEGRWREAEARRALAAWRESGLSLAAWCEGEGLGYERVRRWRGRLGSGARTAALLPVHVVGGDRAPDSLSFELELPRGLRVHVPARFEAESLATLLRVLEARP